MAKMIAIMDLEGALLGVVRADPVDIGNGSTMQSVPLHRAGQKHHLIEVPDELIGKKGKELLQEIKHHLAK